MSIQYAVINVRRFISDETCWTFREKAYLFVSHFNFRYSVNMGSNNKLIAALITLAFGSVGAAIGYVLGIMV